MSGWFDSFNQAVGLTEDPAENARVAAEQQDVRAQEGLALQREMYNKGQADFRPFLEAGTGALSRLSEMNAGGGIASDPQYQQYLAEMSGMTDPTKYLTDSKAVFDNPIYKFQRDEANKNLSRSLRSLGRENSTYGINAMGKQNNQLAVDATNQLIGLDNNRFSRLSGLAGTRYASLADQYNRLRDLAGSGQSAAGMTSNAGSNYGQSASQTLSNLGNNQANATLAGGIMRAGQSQNNFNNLSSLANLGMKAYDRWGNNDNGGGYENGSLYDDAGGDINNVDFGDDWGNWRDGSKA